MQCSVKTLHFFLLSPVLCREVWMETWQNFKFFFSLYNNIQWILFLAPQGPFGLSKGCPITENSLLTGCIVGKSRSSGRTTTPHQPPDDHRSRWHCLIAFEQEQWAGTTRHFPCLCKRAVSWDGQVPPDHTWSSCYLFDKCQNCTVCGKHQNCAVVGKRTELLHADCDQDGILLMTKVNLLETI